jgi:hypothetical protein
LLLQVLHGGENLLDKVEALKARSAATKAELEVAARQQAEQQRRLEQLQLQRMDLSAQYSSLEVGEQPGGKGVCCWQACTCSRSQTAARHACQPAPLQ